MSRGSVLFIYNLLLPFALLAYLPGLIVKMIRRGNYGRGFLQRFGIYGGEVGRRLDGGCDVWVHAVSVGEVFVARKLIEEFRSQRGAGRIVLSTTTSTGYVQARKLEGEKVSVIYSPLDLPWIASRVLRKISPKAIVLVEAEIWPNLVSRAASKGIPMMLANARLSSRSEARFLKVEKFVRPIFGQLSMVMVPYEEDVKRWEALGVPGERIRLLGSIKFDLDADQLPAPRDDFRKMIDDLAGPKRGVKSGGEEAVMLLGSTHRGEEKLLSQVYLDLRREFPQLKLVVVPRHFERAGEVIEDLNGLGLKAVLRSTCGDERSGAGKSPGGSIHYLLVDTTGELMEWYQHANLVVIGKSFLGEGGQNPVEPVSVGVPVFFGPRMSNFSQLVTQLTSNGGAVQVWNTEELREKLAHYLREAGDGSKLVERAREVLEGHRGATKRTVSLVLELAEKTG